MSLWVFLDGGHSMPQNRTLRQKFALWCGRRLALRHANVEIDPTARISPEARIHPRGGRIKIGPHCTVAAGAIVQGNVELGEHCSIQTGSILVGYGTVENPEGRIQVGKHVRIAPGVQIIAGNHDISDPDAPIGSVKGETITLDDNVWVAGRVIITAGVTVGSNSVLAAGAVVTKDIPSFSIAGGVPARVLKSRKPHPSNDT